MKCTACGCMMIREVIEEDQLDMPGADSVAHFRKEVEKCWNYQIDKKRPGDKIYHPLKLVREVNKDDPHTVFINERCEQCHMLYSKRATPRTRTNVLEKLGIKL
jgi:hypothetical protein